MTALDRAIDDICRQAPLSVEKLIAAGAARMEREPWRIVAALYPFRPWCWPVDETPDVLLAECRRRIAGRHALARDGFPHLAYAGSELAGLRTAERALIAMIARHAVAEAVAEFATTEVA